MNALKKCGSKSFGGLLALCLALFVGVSDTYAQATAAPAFGDVTDAVDIMGPLTSFTTYAATIIAAVVVIALAFMGVKMVISWIRGLGAAR